MAGETALAEPCLPLSALDCGCAWAPAVDVRTVPDEYVVLIDVPGLRQEAVDVTSDGNTLTIAGARRDRLGTGGVPLRLERPTGEFLRSLRLPDGCDSRNLTTHISEGVLTVRIPNSAQAVCNGTSDVRRNVECASP